MLAPPNRISHEDIISIHLRIYLICLSDRFVFFFQHATGEEKKITSFSSQFLLSVHDCDADDKILSGWIAKCCSERFLSFFIFFHLPLVSAVRWIYSLCCFDKWCQTPGRWKIILQSNTRWHRIWLYSRHDTANGYMNEAKKILARQIEIFKCYENIFFTVATFCFLLCLLLSVRSLNYVIVCDVCMCVCMRSYSCSATWLEVMEMERGIIFDQKMQRVGDVEASSVRRSLWHSSKLLTFYA